MAFATEHATVRVIMHPLPGDRHRAKKREKPHKGSGGGLEGPTSIFARRGA
jgi:hypothetical protein